LADDAADLLRRTISFRLRLLDTLLQADHDVATPPSLLLNEARLITEAIRDFVTLRDLAGPSAAAHPEADVFPGGIVGEDDAGFAAQQREAGEKAR
jgi:hypothetical protein